MHLRRLSAVLLLATLFASSASADLAPLRRVPRPTGPRLTLAMVAALPARGVPEEDVTRVVSAVEAHFAARSPQLTGCMGNADLREDPMRSRVRRFELRIAFDRSGRPSRVYPHRDQGMPQVARTCLLEAGRGVSVRPPPRGAVTVRVVYELR